MGIDRDGVAGDEVGGDRIGTGRAVEQGQERIRHRWRRLVVLNGAAGGGVRIGRRGRSHYQRVMSGSVRCRRDQFRSNNGDVVLGGERIAGEVGAVVDPGGFLRRQEVVLESEHLRRTAGRVASGRVDRHALQVITGSVDEIAALVELEVTAAGEAVDAVEHRCAVGEVAGLLDREEAVAVDGHEGRDRCRLHVALHRVGGAGLRGHAAGELRGRGGLRNEVEERGIDALERGGLRVGDVARDVFQRVGVRAEATDRGSESAEDTHDIFSKFDPGGSPVPKRFRAVSGRVGRRCRKRRARLQNA